MVNYWYKLNVMKNSRYPRSGSKMWYELDNVGKTNWATNVRETLFKYVLGYAWIAQEVENTHVCIHLFKMRVFDWYQQWHEQTSSSAKLELYYQYTNMCCVLKAICSTVQYFPLRNALTRLCCSNHKLAIETGRHVKVLV
jgi:hypothetical protein